MVQTTSNNGRPALSDMAVTAIIGRLCGSSSGATQIPLSLPLSLYQDGRQPEPSAVGDYLKKLLRNPGSFLERYVLLVRLHHSWTMFIQCIALLRALAADLTALAKSIPFKGANKICLYTLMTMIFQRIRVRPLHPGSGQQLLLTLCST